MQRAEIAIDIHGEENALIEVRRLYTNKRLDYGTIERQNFWSDYSSYLDIHRVALQNSFAATRRFILQRNAKHYACIGGSVLALIALYMMWGAGVNYFADLKNPGLQKYIDTHVDAETCGENFPFSVDNLCAFNDPKLVPMSAPLVFYCAAKAAQVCFDSALANYFYSLNCTTHFPNLNFKDMSSYDPLLYCANLAASQSLYFTDYVRARVDVDGQWNICGNVLKFRTIKKYQNFLNTILGKCSITLSAMREKYIPALLVYTSPFSNVGSCSDNYPLPLSCDYTTAAKDYVFKNDSLAQSCFQAASDICAANSGWFTGKRIGVLVVGIAIGLALLAMTAWLFFKRWTHREYNFDELPQYKQDLVNHISKEYSWLASQQLSHPAPADSLRNVQALITKLVQQAELNQANMRTFLSAGPGTLLYNFLMRDRDLSNTRKIFEYAGFFREPTAVQSSLIQPQLRK